MMSPTGTFTRKAQRQETSVVSQPPTSGPIAATPPMVDPQIAKAMARSRPTKRAFTVERVEGRIIAPPTPWRNRPRMRISPLGARAATRLAPTNTTVPSRKRRRRPHRSPARPAEMSRAAKTRE
jgi:hypothetical protein